MKPTKTTRKASSSPQPSSSPQLKRHKSSTSKRSLPTRPIKRFNHSKCKSTVALAPTGTHHHANPQSTTHRASSSSASRLHHNHPHDTIASIVYDLVTTATLPAPHLHLNLPPINHPSRWNSALTHHHPLKKHPHELPSHDLGEEGSLSWNPPWFPRKHRREPDDDLPAADYPYPEGKGTALPPPLEIELESGANGGVIGRAGGSNSGINREAEKHEPKVQPKTERGITIPVALSKDSV